MSAMIKALTRQLDARLPLSGPALFIAVLWAGTFAAFVFLGLRL